MFESTEVKNTESKEDVVQGDKNIEGEKKPENEEKKDEKVEDKPQEEKLVMTPELKQFIYILRTNIILWSGKNEADVVL